MTRSIMSCNILCHRNRILCTATVNGLAVQRWAIRHRCIMSYLKSLRTAVVLSYFHVLWERISNVNFGQIAFSMLCMFVVIRPAANIIHVNVQLLHSHNCQIITANYYKISLNEITNLVIKQTILFSEQFSLNLIAK